MDATGEATPALSVGMVTIDCEDPQRLGQFWSAALGLPVQTDTGDYIYLARPRAEE